MLIGLYNILLVQSSFGHSIALFFLLCRLIKWREKKNKKTQRSCFQVLKIQGQDEPEGLKSVWRRSQCHTYHTPSHARQGEVFPVAAAFACLLNVCVPSEAGSDTGRALPLLLWLESKAPLLWLKNQPLYFKLLYVRMLCSPVLGTEQVRVQGQAGWGSEYPDLAVDSPVHCRGPDDL